MARIPELFKPDDFTHLVVFTEQGKANVHNGVMYLDLTDTYSVFVHELAHFSGFIDEYPISRHQAERFCHLNNQHPNIILLDEQKADLSSMDLTYWQNIAGGLEISKSRTCNNHPNQAYKLSSKLTFMEFHDANLIPESYLNIWKHRLQSKQAMISAHVNIAHALEDAGLEHEAERWWQQFRLFSGE